MNTKKTRLLSIIFAIALSMIGVDAFAHDYEETNSDGVTIYYKWLNNGSEWALAVSFRGFYSSEYENEYTGNVVIPETVTYNGKNYPVTTIESFAFEGCKGLTSVTIPNSVTSIGDGALTACSGLTSVTIPNSVTSIGDYAFNGCSGLTSIKVESGNAKYDSRNDCNAIIETNTNTIIAGCQNTIIPNTATSIGNYAFASCSSLTSLTIPNSITSIGDYAFASCSGLTSLTIPNSVTSIGNYAFYYCRSLNSVTIPNSVASIADYAFQGCSGLTSVSFPNNVTNIGDYAFSSCSGLTSLTIPSSVSNIGDGAFAGCSGLTEISIFSRNIGRRAFYSCTGLTSVTIPVGVSSIGDGAFAGCSGLTSVKVDNGNTKYDSRNNCRAIIETNTNTLIVGCKNTVIPSTVTSIGKNAFEGCSGLTSFIIPNTITRIGDGAFYGCSGLTSIIIPNTVTSIGRTTFYNCSGLTSVIIPNSVTSIGYFAFGNCSGLTSVTIPNSVTSIGEGAFSECSGLTSITIPNSVTGIGDLAFQGCNGLTEIYSMITEPFETSINCWFRVNKDIPLYVPLGSKSKYQAMVGWNEFNTILEMNISTENTLAMDNLTGHVGSTVTLPIQMNNLQKITGLQFDLYLPEGVTVAKKANGKNDITVTERMEEDYSLSSNTMDDGCVRVSGLSLESTPFTGNSGAIVNVVLQVDGSVTDGDYQIQVKDIILSDVNGVAHKPATASCVLTVKSYVPGDVDDSGDININDAVCIVNYILNKPNANFIPEAADLDGSGDININDAVVLINKYILKRANAKAMKAPRRAATGTDNYLSIGAISIKPGETKTVSVDMTNTEGIQGLQCSIDLPEGLSFATKSNGKIDISNNTDRGDGFTLSSSLQEDGSLTVATVNFEGDSYYGNSGTIFTFKIKADENMAAGEYEIKVCDIVLSSGVAIKPSDAIGKVTVEGSSSGLQQIDADSNQSDSIYNLNGQRVKKPNHGVYIHNGKKVIVE